MATFINLTTALTTVSYDGVWFSTDVYGAGTGIIDPFVRIQANGDEWGINSGGDGSVKQLYDETGKYGSQYNQALNLSDVPILTLDEAPGQQFYVFKLELARF